ncbi:sigma-70 family RNA polymerase sigma factor [Singulisphaera sp. Ch08]|uniref:Sigma-70 family RNA polymerase sigma factor n=1 Tax=Singulisphaera sp. Ch08 TaxID=3120278 RepID=A0AAU7CLH6_9BACT
MGESTDGIVLKHLQTLYSAGAIGGLSDGQLGDRVLPGRDDATEAAFTILAERHGPMVLRVCRQMLCDRHEAEDAFQATFLVLASKVHAIRNRDSMAGWLHGVARRVAQRAKADAGRRRNKERRAAILASVHSPEDSQGPSESWPELHEEIAQLPERYREPIVLCYLEGLTTEAAAQRLGCPKGTVLSRLSRAKERLRKSLIRRGVVVPTGLLAAEWGVDVALAMPTALLETTVRASLDFTARQAGGTTLASTTAVGLARGVLYAMTLSQWKTFGAATLACVLAMGSLRAFAQFGGIGAADEPPAVEQADNDHQAALSQSVKKIQAQLDKAARRNTELGNQLQAIQAELKSLLASSTPAKTKGTKPEEGATSRSIEPATKESSIEVTPMVGLGSAALLLKGPNITRIAAARSLTGRWITCDLREPVNGVASPIVGKNVVVYRLGRYVYAFSSGVQRWDILELPKGFDSSSGLHGEAESYMVYGHMYSFDQTLGKWKDLNFNAILKESPENHKEEDATTAPPRSRSQPDPTPQPSPSSPSPETSEPGPSAH